MQLVEEFLLRLEGLGLAGFSSLGHLGVYRVKALRAFICIYIYGGDHIYIYIYIYIYMVPPYMYIYIYIYIMYVYIYIYISTYRVQGS